MSFAATRYWNENSDLCSNLNKLATDLNGKSLYTGNPLCQKSTIDEERGQDTGCFAAKVALSKLR